MEGVSTTLGNAYEIHEQNYVPRLQGRVSQIWSCHRKFILGISCVRWITSGMLNGLMGSKADSHFGDPWSFRGRVDFSIFDIANLVLCWLFRLNPGTRGEHLTSQPSWAAAWLPGTRLCSVYLVKGGCYFGSVYLLLGGRWAGKDGRVVSWEVGKGVWLKWSDKVGKVCE